MIDISGQLVLVSEILQMFLRPFVKIDEK